MEIKNKVRRAMENSLEDLEDEVEGIFQKVEKKIQRDEK